LNGTISLPNFIKIYQAVQKLLVGAQRWTGDLISLFSFLESRLEVMPCDKNPQRYFIYIHAKGWMDENGMKLWLEKLWSKRPAGILKKLALSVCDQLRSHITEATKRVGKELNTKLDMIPEGLTSQL
jgi:hypothetical protein